MKFIVHLLEGDSQQLLQLPDQPWIAGWKAFVPIEPPLAGLEQLDCAGAAAVWCEFGGGGVEDETGVGVADLESAHQQFHDFCRAHFHGASFRIFHVQGHSRKAPRRTWQLGEPTPGFIRFTFMRRLSEITHDQFASRWCDGHWPLVQRHHPGLSGYVQNVVLSCADATAVATAAPTPAATITWDGMAELGFATAHDMAERMYDSESGKQAIWNDIAGFLNAAAGERFYAQEVWLKEPPSEG